MQSFKLEMLEMTAYRTGGGVIGRYRAAFNPATLKRSFEVEWSRRQPLGSIGSAQVYQRNIPERLSFDLLLDGTDEEESGSVDHQIAALDRLTIRPVGETHEPALLKVTWGALSFTGRLRHCEVRYTLFDRDGKALRAEVSLQLLGDDASKRRGRANGLSSPDMTHRRMVKAGDSLPLLAEEIYGDPDRYLDIADWNGLDHFRSLRPGQELFFPPLTELPGGEEEAEGALGDVLQTDLASKAGEERAFP